jgi:PII-like signaling protein
VNEDCLKLTTYFGERDRAGDRFLADALLDLYGRAGVQVSVLLRGTEGFGAHHRLHTQRVLTLSEDLPVVAVAVDARERIEHLADEVRAVSSRGLVTLERARMLTGRTGGIELDGPAKLTVYVGRKERLDGEPAYRGVVALLRRHGVDGATVLLGVDGTARGVRRRARFFGGNVDVPLMIIAVGGGEAIAAAAGELSMRLARPLMTLERVRVCKRDGALLAEPHDLASGGDWQKLTVYAGETLYTELVRGLRAAGASGATALRGI